MFKLPPIRTSHLPFKKSNQFVPQTPVNLSFKKVGTHLSLEKGNPFIPQYGQLVGPHAKEQCRGNLDLSQVPLT